ncbi:MAG: ATP-binding protein [Candidatus Ancillula sp.]|jgi:predicted AAA+ superfamily ATPase|nr:ATP-binding protein [Candidatus Ancillula sp.]
MIKREIEATLLKTAKSFPVVFLTGPRQSGKSTLLKYSFPDYTYVNLEDPDRLLLAKEDPRGFLSSLGEKSIIDEAQLYPELFSYIQGIVDKVNKPGMFILSGSQNFLLFEKITQSLAGRVGILELLPFSNYELVNSKISFSNIDDWLFNGSYPRLYDMKIDPDLYFANYIRTYIERDVRQIKNITSLEKFIRFMKLLAARVGQQLNISNLSNEADIDSKTVRDWLSILEASYIIKILYPYHPNFNKRYTKSPKIYFYDSGIVCSLLEIESAKSLNLSPIRGHLFESQIISEYIKRRYAKGKTANVYFYRESEIDEIDLIYSDQGKIHLCEIKSSQTAKSNFAKTVNKLSDRINKDAKKLVIYSGQEEMHINNVTYKPWSKFLM